MNSLDGSGGAVSIEQLRAAFGSGSPAAVHGALEPFLRHESRSSGDTRVINEIADSVSKLLYPWFQGSEAMGADSQRALYALLRPGGRLVDTLLQYHILQQQHAAAVAAAASMGGAAAAMTLPLLSLPVEYHAVRGADVARAMSLPADLARRLAPEPGAGFSLDALEYFVYHFCKALVPPRGDAAVRPGLGSVAQCLAREYIGFFLPVAVPERLAGERGDADADRSPMRHLRERLHDLSPRRDAGAAHDGREAHGADAARPGVVEADLLDACDYGQALALAGFFAACAALLWLPAIPAGVLEAARRGGGVGGGDSTGAAAAGWVWVPSPAQLPALHLFHMAVGYVAKGERQMERFHLAAPAPDSSDHVAAAYAKRIAMNGTVRDTLRARCLSAAVADTLRLVLAGCGQVGFLDSEIWIPFVDVTTSIWIRYIMPWRGARGEQAPAGSEGGAVSALWQSRVPLMMKGVPPALYGATLALFLRQITGPSVDLLAHTAAAGSGARGVQAWLHGAVSSVLGHVPTVDVLAVIDRVVGAFTPPELRAILAAAERCQLDALPRRRDQITPEIAPDTPTRRRDHAALPQPADDGAFERLVGAAQPLVAPYAGEIVACRSGSAALDAALADGLGRPPVCAVFGPEPSALLRRTVLALRGAEVLAERQLRLLAPAGSADQARSAVADLFLVISRLFSASEDAGPARAGASETMRARAQSLAEAQTRIRTLYARLAVVFCATRADVEAIAAAHDDALLATAPATPPARAFGAPPGFGDRRAARGAAPGRTPDMARGALTPRGRWELKTGRKKFTAQSLLGAPDPHGAGADPRGSGADPLGAPDQALLPRGPRAVCQARSYESQWLLDRVLRFNVLANRLYQQLLAAAAARGWPVPPAARACRLDFRWAAAPQNLRFALLVLVAVRVAVWLLCLVI